MQAEGCPAKRGVTVPGRAGQRKGIPASSTRPATNSATRKISHNLTPITIPWSVLHTTRVHCCYFSSHTYLIPGGHSICPFSPPTCPRRQERCRQPPITDAPSHFKRGRRNPHLNPEAKKTRERHTICNPLKRTCLECPHCGNPYGPLTLGRGQIKGVYTIEKYANLNPTM